jgi:hypothetical protein
MFIKIKNDYIEKNILPKNPSKIEEVSQTYGLELETLIKSVQ